MTMRIAIIASGGGTNAQALLEASERGELGGGKVVAVVSDRERAGALERARSFGVEALFVDPLAHPSREAYAEALVEELVARGVKLVCLAGFMRILPPVFVKAFEDKVLNIHPALLPSFPGAHPVRDALEWGVKVTGATVHFADEAVDQGPIILQEAVPVLHDGEDALHERIKAVEHRLYPRAVKAVCEGRVRIEGRKVTVEEPEGAGG